VSDSDSSTATLADMGQGGDSREQVIEALRDERRFVVATHENPDGDAIGSLAAMQQVLAALGKDAVAYIAPGELPLPYEYRFVDLRALVTKAPADLATRTVVFLDCGNIDRNPADELKHASRILNIDHHHDNTHFGTIAHVVPRASCTAEIVWDLMKGLGVPLTQPVAEALYVGLVTDTGKFMYENTGPLAHTMAAELIEAGVDVHAVYRHLYEGVPQGKLELLARGLSSVRRYDGGLLTVAHLSREDYAASGADESHSEGVVDHLRSLEGTAVAALIRDLRAADGDGAVRRKVSLRATDDRVDVSVIARALGGGGHRRAAGLSTDLGVQELVAVLRDELARQL
jgi:phosphoesterase RecJ-like protein